MLPANLSDHFIDRLGIRQTQLVTKRKKDTQKEEKKGHPEEKKGHP